MFKWTFKTNEAISRSRIYRQWHPHSRCSDSEGTRSSRSEY